MSLLYPQPSVDLTSKPLNPQKHKSTNQAGPTHIKNEPPLATCLGSDYAAPALYEEAGMAKQLLIYERVVPVSSDAHRNISIKRSDDYSFAAKLNSVPLLAAEFLAAAQDYPIVFANSDSTVFPAVLLGFEDGINLCVDTDGAWTGGYIPAFVRRYPFVFAEGLDGENGKFTLCIDEAYPGINSDGRGERLFDADGNRTQFLNTNLSFVTQFQAQFARTKDFGAKLAELGLLEPAQANYTTADGRTGSLSGFSTVVRDRLKALPEKVLQAMFAADELELCFAHLHSLQNINRLGAKVPQVASGMAEPTKIEQPESSADTDSNPEKNNKAKK